MDTMVAIRRFTAGAVICLLFLTAGCSQPTQSQVTSQPSQTGLSVPAEPNAHAPQAQASPTAEKPPVQQAGPPKQTFLLALKFSPQDTTRYRVTLDAERSVQWEGPDSTKPSSFKGGHTGNHIEMAFTQKIRGINDKGNALTDITIDSLKYLGKVKDIAVMDFDSARQTDQNEPLAKLIGKTYTIELSPAAQVVKVVDVNQVRTVVNGVLAANKTASQLLSDEVIRERHTVSALDGIPQKQSSVGDTWRNIKSFSFGMMGSRAHERIYSLKEIIQSDNRQIAIVDMNAIPSSDMAKQLHKEEGSGFFSKMFDNTETHSGRLKFDLTAGKVEDYTEQLKTEWIAAEPSTDANQAPAALRMAATQLFHIERIP